MEEVNKVSIITPCYNSELYIWDTYSSIKNQTYSNWEWIVVDDCSTDNSSEILNNITKIDKRLKFIKLEKNSLAAGARNKAMDIAAGRYITFIDSDDLWKNNFLEKSIQYLQEHDETLVYSTYHRVNENLEKIMNDFVAIDKIDYKRILYNCPMPMLTSIYDSQSIGKIYFPPIDLREDHAMWINLLKKIKYARAIKEPLAFYRIRKHSTSRNKIKIAKKQFALYYKFLNKNLFISLYYTACWAVSGVIKYGKF